MGCVGDLVAEVIAAFLSCNLYKTYPPILQLNWNRNNGILGLHNMCIYMHRNHHLFSCKQAITSLLHDTRSTAREQNNVNMQQHVFTAAQEFVDVARYEIFGQPGTKCIYNILHAPSQVVTHSVVYSAKSFVRNARTLSGLSVIC